MKRQTQRENLCRRRQKTLPKNQISTSEHVITRKGESKDKLSLLYKEENTSSTVHRDAVSWLDCPAGPWLTGKRTVVQQLTYVLMLFPHLNNLRAEISNLKICCEHVYWKLCYQTS